MDGQDKRKNVQVSLPWETTLNSPQQNQFAENVNRNPRGSSSGDAQRDYFE